MQIKYEQRRSLPRLAWCACVSKHDDTVYISHGPWVETEDVFFCEGAWNGKFEQGGIEYATSFMGSGGSLHDNGIIFASPTHILERLYLIRNKELILVSNSLAFVLAEANDCCDPCYHYYITDLIDFYNKHHAKTHTFLPTLGDNKVHLYQNCNLVVMPSLEVKVEAKSLFEQVPKNFVEYRAMLTTAISDINKNAISENRKKVYAPLATISSGYDSTACAVLASEVGCTEAVTFALALKGFPWGGSDLNDSGKLIGESIGMKVTEFDRTEYMRRGNFPEAEFFAYGSGLDANWLGLEDAVVGRMVFTGIHGDFLWERLGFPEIWNSLAHLTLTEFRLRTGYIHIAPCTIGMNHYNSIRMISNSQEMQPWSIGSFYDRPIPRRIGEEAGIDRLLFGQQKKVTVIDMRSGHRGMTAASASDFKKYIKLVSKPRSLLQKVLFAPNKLLFHINLLINSKITIMAKYFGKKIHLLTFMSEKYRVSPRLSNLTFHWGHEKIRNRYK